MRPSVAALLAALRAADALAWSTALDDVARLRDAYLDALARAHLLAADDSPEETALGRLLEDACAGTHRDLETVQECASADLHAEGLL